MTVHGARGLRSRCDFTLTHRDPSAASGRNPKNYTTKSTKDTKVGIDGAIQYEFFSFFVLFVTFVVSSLEIACQKDKMLRLCSTEIRGQGVVYLKSVLLTRNN